MKFIVKILATGVAVFGLAAGAAFSGSAGSALASKETAPSFSTYESLSNEQVAKYSRNVMRAVRTDLGVDADSTQLDDEIRKMPKVQVMDHYFSSFGKKVKGNEIRLAIKEIFEIDLAYISKNDYGSKLDIYPANVMGSLRASFHEQPDSTEQDARIMSLTKNEVMDRYIKEHSYGLTGAESRLLINQIFGVNLNGISTLEYSQLAISSKGQWIVKSDMDLFILESSMDDVDVSIYTTAYFKETTGSDQLPESLKIKLMDLGFTYNAEANLLYYKNPFNESVPDAFKGQVIGILVGTIAAEYKN